MTGLHGFLDFYPRECWGDTIQEIAFNSFTNSADRRNFDRFACWIRLHGVGFVVGSFVGVVFSFGWAFKDHDVIDLDQLRTLVGIGPSDQEWIQKADRKGIYLPREATHVRFDDQSGWHGAFRYDFELESDAVSRLRDQKKLKKQIPVDRFHCQPDYGFLGATDSDTKRYDITSFRVGNWQGSSSGIMLEVSKVGSARGCAYATGTN
jgi:hypothetical protein